MGLRIKSHRFAGFVQIGRRDVGGDDPASSLDRGSIEKKQWQPAFVLSRRSIDHWQIAKPAAEPRVAASPASPPCILPSRLFRNDIVIMAREGLFEQHGAVVDQGRAAEQFPRQCEIIAEPEPDKYRRKIIASHKRLQTLAPGENSLFPGPLVGAKPGPMRGPARRCPVWILRRIRQGRADDGRTERTAGNSGYREDAPRWIGAHPATGGG